MAHLAPENVVGTSAKDVHDIWDLIMALASREKFQTILRTVRMENPMKREFNSIPDMQQNIH